MPHKTVPKRFSTIVHRALSEPISRAIQAHALAIEIGERRSWINNAGYGSLFATLQVILADEFVLSITRMFDPPSQRYPTQSIPALIEFMIAKARWLPIVSRAPLQSALIAAGDDPGDVQALRDAELTKRVARHYQTVIPNVDRHQTDKLSASLNALRFRRDKQIAHTELVKRGNKIPAEWLDGTALLDWALNFGDVVGIAYMDYYFLASDRQTYMRSHFAREAATALGRLLDHAGLPRGRFRRGAA